MARTVRELIEGGLILCPEQLRPGTPVVIVEGRARWTGSRFHVTPGSRTRFRVQEVGTIVDLMPSSGEEGTLQLFYYQTGWVPEPDGSFLPISRDVRWVWLDEHFALPYREFVQQFPAAPHLYEQVFMGLA